MKFKFSFILIMLFFFSGIVFAEKSILYITDNTHMSNNFNTKYVDMLQNLIDDNFGKDNISISNFSKFDMNTSQCLEFFDSIFGKEHQDAIVLMIGDSNYHNLYGFTEYIKTRDADKPVNIKAPKDIYEINKEMLKLYAGAIKNGSFPQIVDVVYKTLINSRQKGSFEPKVIPHFYALNDDFVIDNNFMATIETYRYSWELIRANRYEEAKAFLDSIIKRNPSQSMLYYALGSAYLSENKEGSEFIALQCFEDGILIDPLNKDNVCYKGLVLLYMVYKGELAAEVLYFVRGLNEYITFPNEQLEAIMAINTVDYDKKIKVINDWILYDMEKLKNKAVLSNTKLIFTSYPDDIPINSLISEYVKNTSRVLYIDNKADPKDNSDFVIYRLAKKLYEFLKENKIIN
ncbi:MAG: hypothetical protein K5622_07600 [Endomicrobiaceae bacterium]|nr:hypothetical protein [Endomicrobiaceae bacterium]